MYNQGEGNKYCKWGDKVFFTHIENVFSLNALMFYFERVILLLIIYLIPIKIFMKDRIKKSTFAFITVLIIILFFLFSLFSKQYYNSQIVIGYIIFLCLLLFFSFYNIRVLGKDSEFQYFLINLTLFLHIWLYCSQLFSIMIISRFGNRFSFFLGIILLGSLLFSKLFIDKQYQKTHRMIMKRTIQVLGIYIIIFVLTIGFLNIISGVINGELRVVLYEHFWFKELFAALAPNATVVYENVFGLAYLAVVSLIIVIFPMIFFIRLLVNEETSRKKLLEQEIIEKDLYFYIDYVESFNMRLRKIQHDYANILLGFGGLIYEEPVKSTELKQYYQRVMTEFEVETSSNLRVSSLKYVKNVELAGLLVSKMMRAYELEIEIGIEVKESIFIENVNTVDLARVLGIMIDNAIEAAGECEEPQVKIALIKLDQSTVVFHISNNTVRENIVAKMNQRSFTTKGENRGLGLDIVKEIIEREEHLALQLEQDTCWISQILTITH